MWYAAAAVDVGYHQDLENVFDASCHMHAPTPPIEMFYIRESVAFLEIVVSATSSIDT